LRSHFKLTIILVSLFSFSVAGKAHGKAESIGNNGSFPHASVGASLPPIQGTGPIKVDAPGRGSVSTQAEDGKTSTHRKPQTEMADGNRIAPKKQEKFLSPTDWLRKTIRNL
jgi:hypothetical protein